MRRKISAYRKVLSVILGIILIGYLTSVPPETILNIVIFYLLILLNLIYLLSLFFARFRVILYTLLITAILLLAQFNILNFFNLLILMALAVSVEIYFRK
ncbi:MAG: hypothetical protein UV73_C0003G0155 [Candidatus Gottesmanbacteria bacterium GW2011_GWA2_43_14]|uniref:Uncharacterized protein n=1 Tax=Candidatus Gottesmanbacteria bacterium GW2011_GWA2_43_14 TaxID=1618443 RepID=A0A0G1GHE7_9BACT|nr:MAG: hypothetical protein UV73_C0003G0155 [Candidatus Gottesmanbacteria bacterium GW2011_GWA2_43_14]